MWAALLTQLEATPPQGAAPLSRRLRAAGGKPAAVALSPRPRRRPAHPVPLETSQPHCMPPSLPPLGRYVDKAHAKAGTALKVSVRGKLNDAAVTKMPFVPTHYHKPPQ